MEAATTTTTERVKRFNDVLDGYELGAGDFTARTDQAGELKLTRDFARVEAAEQLQRYVVITESQRGFGYFAESVNSIARAGQQAALNHHEGWMPVCVFDLDELAGDPPEVEAGEEDPDDDRMPVRYGLARVEVVVAFNSVPTDA